MAFSQSEEHERLENDPAPPGKSPAVTGSSATVVQPSTLNVEPPQIPDHELLRCIGRGSYGEVWLARNVLGEFRAIKVVYRKSFEHDRPYERKFEGIQKFEPISRLHESQVDILHVGRNDEAGYFYYVMELADGEEMQNEKCKIKNEATVNPTSSGRPQSILNSEFFILNYRPHTLKLDLYRRSRLPVDECIQIGLALTTALEHLHSHGLVHRDVKPSNIIFVGGVPKLADIGLVASMDATMSFVGTSGFLPPEGPGTPQGDIYSLGKVLYEISTGRDRQDFPKLPPDLLSEDEPQTKVSKTTPHSEFRTPHLYRLLELNEIILKACQSDPCKRYQSANEMHAELEVLQHGQSVKRRRSVERRVVFAKKAAVAAALLALLLAGGWFVSTNVNWRKPGSTERKVTPAQQQEARRLYNQASTLPSNTQAALNTSIELLNRAIVEDPNYAQAYADLAYRYQDASGFYLPQAQAMGQAKVNALRALQLDELLPRAHLALAFVYCRHELDLTQAKAHFQRAIELAPNDGVTYGDFAAALSLFGLFDEANQVLKRGELVNPNDHNLLGGWCWRYYLDRDFEKARQAADRLTTVHPDSVMGPWFLSLAHEGRCDYSKALEVAERAAQMDPSPDSISQLGRLHARLGHREEAQKALDGIRLLAQSPGGARDYAAEVLLALGERDRAIEELQRAVDDYPPTVLYLKARPFWDDLRSDPRFQALLKNVNLDK